MPHAIHLTLDPRTAKRPLPSHAIPAIHANFYQWLAEADPALAKTMDNAEGAKPFTTSPLYQCNGRCEVRLTILDDSLLDLITLGLDRRPYAKIYGDQFPIVRQRMLARSYADLSQNAGAQSAVVLCFDTPLSFTSREMDYILPDPVFAFSSYIDRWNAFVPHALQVDPAYIEWVRDAVAVSRFDLHSQALKFKSHQLIGCTGRIQYRIVKTDKSTPLAVHTFNALASFAEFCGTGRKTTQGMGQTTRYPQWDLPEPIPRPITRNREDAGSLVMPLWVTHSAANI